MERTILIAGAGIAGLTVALALARRGVQTQILEAFEKPSEVGAGIQISPNASRILRSLGVLEALEEKSIAVNSIRLGDALSGQILLEMDITAEWTRRMGAPYLIAHRAVVHEVLFDAATNHPLIAVQTGHRLQEIREFPDHVVAVTETPVGMREITAPVLIGADGIWSKSRMAVPGAARVRPTGRIAWRAIVPRTSETGTIGVTAWMSPQNHLVCYPAGSADMENLVAITSGATTAETWAAQSNPREMQRMIESNRNAFDPDKLANADWTIWPLNTVDSDAAWNTDRVILIGDAAHGLEPFAAQGAAMAIEDAFALAVCMSEKASDPGEAFVRYRSLRSDRLKRVAKRTAFNRWVYHQSGPGRWARNRLMTVRPSADFLDDLEWLYNYTLPQ